MFPTLYSYSFNDNNPFWVTYFDHDPGVDSNNVQVLVNNGAGGWLDVSTQFVITATMASLKPDATLTISTNMPQIKLQVYEKGYTNDCARFILNYTILDASLAAQPFVQDLSQFLFARDISRTVVLEGQNFGGVTTVDFRSATNNQFSQSLLIIGLHTGLTKVVGNETITYDSLTVQVRPPCDGTAFFWLNGIAQPQAPVLVVEASSQTLIDHFVNNMKDVNGDGVIDVRDLDANGDGLPDASRVTLVEPPYSGRSGIQLPTWLDQYPAVWSTSYDPHAANVFSNMATWGYAGTSDLGYGPIVIVSPQADASGHATIYGDMLNFAGLVPNNVVSVTIQFASGIQPVVPVTLGPSGLYPGASDPFVFQATIGLTKPSSGTDVATIVASCGTGNPSITNQVNLTWDIATPQVLLDSLHSHPIVGYHSLYECLSVDGVLQMQHNYTVGGLITHDEALDLTTLEFRLDNERIPNSLFAISPGFSSPCRVLTFFLKDNARIDIYARWQDKPLTNFLTIDNLVYGPHTLEARIADVHGKVGTSVETFRFDHGAKFTVNARNTNTCVSIDPPPSAAGSAGTAAYNLVSNSICAAAQYATSVDAGGQIDPNDFTGATYGEYIKLATGAKPAFNAQGPVAVTLSGLPTYVGGAIEQMFLNSNREFRISTGSPGNFEYPFSAAVASIDKTTITTWKYVVTSWSNSPQRLDLTSLFQPASDSFALAGSCLLTGTEKATCDGTSTSVVTPNPVFPGWTNNASYPGGGGFSSGGGGGMLPSWGAGDGASSSPANQILRTADLFPRTATVHVGDSQAFTLSFGPGTYGPTNQQEDGWTTAGDWIHIETNNQLANVSAPGTATLTAQFPAIANSQAGYFLARDSADHYYYDMCYLFNFRFYVDGIAIGDTPASLTTNNAHYVFLPVSDPYAGVVVDERTLLVTHQTPGDPYSPALLNFDLLVRDPVATNALDPTAYSPRVSVNGVTVPSGRYAASDLPGTYRVSVMGQPVAFGINHLDFKVESAVGSVTHVSYVVEIGDQDGLRVETPDDLYIVSQDATIATIQNPKTYTKTIFGEFPGDTQVSCSGLADSSMTLRRYNNCFGRFARPFFILDNYPMEGAILIPASAPGAPVVVQQPGGTSIMSAGNNVKVYAEGVSIVSSDGTPTHNLIPGEIASSSFTLSAFVDTNRVQGAPSPFVLRLFDAYGSAIGATNLIQVSANDAGAIFDNLGRKYVGTDSITITNALPGDARYMVVNGQKMIVLHSGEFVQAQFASLTTLAGAMIKINLDGDCNLNGNYNDDETIEKTPPGLLVPQTDDASSSWSNSLIKVRLTGAPKGVNVGSVILTATITNASGGQIKVWSTNSTPATATLWINTTNNLMSHTWTLGPATFASLPEWLYVQGVTNSTAAGDVKLQASYLSPDGTLVAEDDLVITVMDRILVPDFDHDKKIDATDVQLLKTNGLFRFWINDDSDKGDTAEEAPSMCNVPDYFGNNPNYFANTVSGRADLLDFFPVWVNLKKMLDVLPPGNGIEYRLSQANAAVKFVYTDLDRMHAGDFLTNDVPAYGSTFANYAYQADAILVTPNGVALSQSFLGRIRANPDKGVLLMEGAGISDAPLVLEIWRNGSKIAAENLPLKISSVEDMYRWINLRNVTQGSVAKPSNTDQPKNYPDSLCNGKMVAIVHGYACAEDDARADSAEVFKRLYQSGSHAMFTAVGWHANFNPISGGNYPITAYLFYHADAHRALDTAPALTAALQSLPGGQLHLVVHSQGNLLVSEAIAKCGLNPYRYYMIDAAVATEAYDGKWLPESTNKTTGTYAELVSTYPSDGYTWLDYSNRLWSAQWHELFADTRHDLTWRKRFGNLTCAINYHSTGEEVLENNPACTDFTLTDLIPIPGLNPGNPMGHHAWIAQEQAKGGDVMAALRGETSQGGWGFNWRYDFLTQQLTPKLANGLSDSDLRTKSFFKPFNVPELYDPNQDILANNPVLMHKLLAEAIPALSHATGSNPIDYFGVPVTIAGDGNIDLMTMKRGDNAWPSVRGSTHNWLHGDFRDVAYFYNYNLYDDIVSKGGLK
jgi:hypothetical protein